MNVFVSKIIKNYFKFIRVLICFCFKFLLTLVFAIAVITPSDVYPDGISATSFQNNMAPPFNTHDLLEDRDSIVLRQDQPNQQIL